jgi:5-methylcytosine-specific restriction endonuclease McrBC regulatory subunit McrC
LAFGGSIRATFDAKYKKRKEGAKWPSREDIYQVVATAAAYDSPLAVLVYPEKFETVWWNVNGLKGTPMKLAAVGLGLFSFKPGTGDRARGREILDILDASQSSYISLAGNISI